MTARSRIDRLLLFNWKGLFFQPFELHEAVTALEGENGAGKTTVMIAAFVALLPDLQRLWFRNIGEGEGGGDGDRGIYGRLGVKGPSYSLLDLRTGDGARVVAGVCLLRGAPPSIEFKRFVVEGLPHDCDLDALVLGRDGETERIPEFGELRESFACAGATLRLHDRVGGYCGQLHELGVLPMRMEQPQDRQRYWQMLHTSMYGGFSGALQKGLRDYLLNEDQRLRNHVVRMRENLETCRITRQRIAEADGRYRLIGEVFRFSWGMVEAAFHGTRLFAETRRASADETRQDHRRCLQTVKAAALEHERLTSRMAELQRTLGHLKEADREAAELLEHCRAARRLRTTRDALGPLRAGQEDARVLAQQARDAAQAMVATARDHYARAGHEHNELTRNLASAQDAFEAISNKVGQYRAACRSLTDARAALPDRSVELGQLDALITVCEQAWQAAVRTQGTARQELDGAQDRRARFDVLLAVLGRLLGSPVVDREAADTARLLDTEYRDLEARLSRAQDLPERIRDAEERARRQAGLRRRLAPLVPACGPLDHSEQVRAAQATHAQRQRTLQDRQGELRERGIEHRGVLALAGERAAALELELTAWRHAQALADALRTAMQRPIDDAGALAALHTEWIGRDDTLGICIEQQARQRRQLIEEAEQLENGGGRLDDSLIGLADRLNGQLLAERFDDLSAAEAARPEARLGPLHAALVVPDVAAAAAVAAGQERRPQDLWLIPAGGPADLPPGETKGDSELVRMGDVWRLSRRPQRPVVGRAAREQEIACLWTEAQMCEQARDALRSEREQVRGHLRQAAALAAEVRRLVQPSPEPELRGQRRIQSERTQQLRADEAALAALQPALIAGGETCTALEACLTDAALLDEEDWSATLRRLRQERAQVQAARDRLEQSKSDIAVLRDGFLDLQQNPPDTGYLEGLRRRQDEAEQVLDYWARGRRLLNDLSDHRFHFAYADQEALLTLKDRALARDAWRKALIELRPNWRNWFGLRRQAAGLGLLPRLDAHAADYQGLGPPTVMTLASERRGQLGEALKRADGGTALAEQLERGRGAQTTEGGAGLRDLRAWGLVRGFLEQSIPRDIAQSDDPEVALVQINQHLALLRERLLEQEQTLRHSTEEIANSIQVKIRREATRIGNLNRGLARVRFGSIRGVRIHLERHALMQKLLDAMRTQPDLFEQDAPLEDAMAAVYRYIGGGQVQGDRLLDYREYVRISVQVQRLGQDAWGEARAGVLSTGESIGVGAAVLVVILDAWEQQAALLKGRKAGQALRFLFLDEASRLSPESLDTLTEFCEHMQVQLLAAAPAADRARRGHIYRLVRRTDSHGEEEVVVRGRRMRDALE